MSRLSRPAVLCCRGNVVDLAVAVVVGSAFTSLISAVVSDWLTPFIAVIFGKTDGTFGSKQFVIRGSVFNYGCGHPNTS